MALTDIHKTIITNIKAMLYDSSLLSYKLSVSTQELSLKVVADDVIPTSTEIRLSDVIPFTPGYIVEVGDYVILRLEAFLIDVISRVESIGYAVTESDSWMIGFNVQKVENSIRNLCNTASISDGLHRTAVDMICGEFLFAKKQSGQLTGFDFEAVMKQIQEGDTSITFAIGSGSLTPEQRFEALLSHLMNYGKNEFISYRRLKW